MMRALRTIVAFVALVTVWEGLVLAKIWSPVLLPSPVDVAKYLADATRDGTLLKAGLQ